MMNESKCEGERLGFLGLFKRYEFVEVPLIQRDYAQGRESAKAVREHFLDSIFATLADDKQPLSLDFIYGEVVQLENNLSCFQPIDGQQRLTTLFLLHWYLACLAGRRRDFAERLKDKQDKPRFRYSVRKSSDQFFAALLNFDPVLGQLSQALKEQIEDRAWFFRAWRHDTTIQGALVMLEAIRKKFSGDEAKTFYQKLQQADCPITFDVLNLGDLGLSDEIYIKMDARGKDLTGFEKFKAWLIGSRWEKNKLSWPDDGGEAKQWPILLDGDWLDLFWSFQDMVDPAAQKPSEAVSKVYFRTFLALALNLHASEDSLQEEWMKADQDEQRSLWPDIFTDDALKSVFQNLENLASLKKEGLDKLRNNLREKGIPFSKDVKDSKDSLCNAFFEGAKDPAFKERLWLHALCLFLEAPRTLQDDVSRDDWFRVTRNLIENSDFEQKNFANAVKSISTLAAMCQAESRSAKNRPVLYALLDSEFLGLQVFDGEQKKEESAKARLMLLDGSHWEGMILEAEKHPVFLGQIGLLLAGTPQLDDFQRRWAVFNHLIDGQGSTIGRNKLLLARAGLRQCEPFRFESQNNLVFEDTAVHWKYLLGSNALELPKGKFRKGMLKLVDHLSESTENSDQEVILNAFCQEPNVDNDWMDDVICYGDILLHGGISRKQKIQNYYGSGIFIYSQMNSSERDIMLGKQAHRRNAIIKSLLDLEIGFSIDEWRKVPEIVDVNPPFYKGRQFLLQQERLPWRISIQNNQIILQQKIPANSQSGQTEKWDDVPDCSFEFSKTAPEVIIKTIKEKMKPSPPETVVQL